MRLKTYVAPSPVELQTVKQLLDRYQFSLKDLGVQKNILGFVNKVFLVKAGGKDYIVRESNPQTAVNHLRLEVELLDYLKERKFSLVPKLFKNKAGREITKLANRYYTIQSSVPGQVKAGWFDLSNFNEKMLINFFKASASFTKVVGNFIPKTKINNKSVFYYVKHAADKLRNMLKKMPSSRSRLLLSRNEKYILSFVKTNLRELIEANYDNLPKQLIHFDIHPGNFNYRGDKISGMFDFDWVRFDSRITDLAGTIAQSCYYIGGKKSGYYRKERILKGLRAYRRRFGRSEFSMERENQLVKIALKGYLIFQLIFFGAETYVDPGRPTDDTEMVRHFDHFIKLLRLNDYEQIFS